MSITILDFEKPIAEVSSKIEALQLAASDNPELLPQIDKLKTQEISLRKKVLVCEHCGRILVDPDLAEAVAEKA